MLTMSTNVYMIFLIYNKFNRRCFFNHLQTINAFTV